MTNKPEPRKRATLDLGEFGDFAPKPKSKTKQPVETVAAEAEGFTSRQAAKPKPKIDGRSLRATGRKEQLNIAVKPETKTEFWEKAQAAGFRSGEEFLLAMLDIWKRDQ